MITELILDTDSLLEAAASALSGGKGFLVGRVLGGAAIVSRVLPDPRKKGFPEGLHTSGVPVLGRFLPGGRPPRDLRGYVTGDVLLLGRRVPWKGTGRRQEKGLLEGGIGGNGYRLEAYHLAWIGPAHQRTWKRIPVLCPEESGNPKPPAPPAREGTPAPPARTPERKR